MLRYYVIRYYRIPPSQSEFLMARRTKLTLAHIAEAAADLGARGQPVTVAAVTAITGGSYSTTGRLLQEWREQAMAPLQSFPDGDGEAVELPLAVARALSGVGPAILAALAEARGEERRSGDAALAALRSENDRVRHQAEAALAAARADLESLELKADQIGADFDAAQSARMEAEHRAQAAEAERTVLARQVGELIEQLATAKSATAAAEQRTAAATAALAQVQEELRVTNGVNVLANEVLHAEDASPVADSTQAAGLKDRVAANAAGSRIMLGQAPRS